MSMVTRHAAAVFAAGLLLAGEAAPAQVSASPARPGADTTASRLPPGTGVWRNYDFVRGDTIWLATDFTSEPVGRFPAGQLQYVSGNMQIVEVDSTRALEASSTSVFRLALPRDLPDDFSVEFEIKVPTLNLGTSFFFSTPTGSVSAYTFDYGYVGGRPGIYRKGNAVSNLYMPRIPNQWVPVRFQVDSVYSIMYVGAERVAQVPVANFPHGRLVEFHLNGNDRFRTYLRNVVVAVGLDDLYKVLSTTGEFSTQGILFDTNSDRLRPESTPVLEQVRRMLVEHAALRLQIEGHTDDVGDDAFNLDLSERRARAVRDWLIAQSIDRGRFLVMGHGERLPVGDNRTAAGRLANRRVVFRRMP